MEKAILKTLVYSDIFSYPLKGYEVYKWLLHKQTTLLKVEKALNSLIKKGKVEFYKDYYFLKGKRELVAIRARRAKYSKAFFNKAKLITQVLKIIPWIKLVGISGGLALNNSEKKDDIDLFLITSKNRLWISRFLTILLLDILGVRRKVNMRKKLSGKFCLNTILDEDHLEQSLKDLYTSHEVLQMKVIWQREGIYTKYLSDNDWGFKFLPNWSSKIKYIRPGRKEESEVLNLLEDLARMLQLNVMKEPKGMERIEEGGLYFHPTDYRGKIIKEFKRRISKI